MVSETPDQINLLRPRSVAKMLNVSVQCLAKWRRTDRGPPFVKIGKRKILYDMQDIAGWLTANRRSRHPSEPLRSNGTSPYDP
jgi:hypothetical protein